MSCSWGVDSRVVVIVNVHEFIVGHLDLSGEGVSEFIELYLLIISLVVFVFKFLHKEQVVSCCSSSSVSIAVPVAIPIAVPSSPVSHGWGVLWRAEGESVGSSGT